MVLVVELAQETDNVHFVLGVGLVEFLKEPDFDCARFSHRGIVSQQLHRNGFPTIGKILRSENVSEHALTKYLRDLVSAIQNLSEAKFEISLLIVYDVDKQASVQLR